jgi:tetratricopeptide (TPR) repeat protein
MGVIAISSRRSGVSDAKPADPYRCIVASLTIILLLLSVLPAASEPIDMSTVTVGSVASLWSDDPHTKGGFEHLYNHEYDDAIREFELAAQSRPNDAFGVNHLLTAVLFRELNRMGALDTGLYTTNNFLSTKLLPADPRARAEISALLTRAGRLSETLLAANPNDVDALYARGVTRSLHAIFLEIVDKAWFAALRSALNARRDHERVLQLSPHYTDAELVVGIHEYVVGSLPRWLKGGAAVFGVHGGKVQGIDHLYSAANGGGETAVNARIALSLFLRREHRYTEALQLVRDLIKSYPRNFLFALEEATLLNAVGQQQDAIAAYRKLLSDKPVQLYSNSRPELAWYGLGEALQGEQRYGDAETAYEHVLEYSETAPDLRRRADARASEMRSLKRKQQVQKQTSDLMSATEFFPKKRDRSVIESRVWQQM